jgi:A/G-specific adenine glycosylase
MSTFARLVIDWQRRHGRHDMPWQGTRDPYRVWLSEIMLQQTQVATVLDYYPRFLARFPDLPALAHAPLEAVLEVWSGLGYYSRARNLHRCARQVIEEHGGVFPDRADVLASLPGIGRSTAAAIAAFAFGHRGAILDGNVKRVLCRVHGIAADPGQREVERGLWRLAEEALPEVGIEPYTQGLMDLGATVCLRRQPGCARCPLAVLCRVGREGGWERIPAPRSRPASPERAISLLVLILGDRVLLEERPQRGIWGGLLSLPELPPGDSSSIALEIERTYGMLPPGIEPLPVIRHAFTHFRLIAQPWLVRIDPSALNAGEPPAHLAQTSAPAPLAPGNSPGQRWLPLDRVSTAALPRPVKQLLSGIG